MIAKYRKKVQKFLKADAFAELREALFKCSTKEEARALAPNLPGLHRAHLFMLLSNLPDNLKE